MFAATGADDAKEGKINDINAKIAEDAKVK
jgi:hypothetical protein